MANVAITSQRISLQRWSLGLLVLYKSCYHPRQVWVANPVNCRFYVLPQRQVTVTWRVIDVRVKGCYNRTWHAGLLFKWATVVYDSILCRTFLFTFLMYFSLHVKSLAGGRGGMEVRGPYVVIWSDWQVNIVKTAVWTLLWPLLSNAFEKYF